MTDELMSEIKVPRTDGSIIMVVGVGGAGGNAVNHMWNLGIRGVTFMVCNTDQQALDKSPVEKKIRLGSEGLGAGNDPENGRRAAVETLPEIRQALEEAGTKMLFITAGMGGGTGTGASPVIAKLAKEMGLLTVAIVTSPLAVEGKIRYEQAFRGIDELRGTTDSLLIINNENILEIYGRLSLKQAFGKADDILASAAKGIAEIITVESDLVNVDFADVSKVMRDSGRAHMAVATAALLPSILYYFSLFMMIHFEAVRKNIGVMPADEIPDARSVYRRLYHILPILILIYFLVSGRSVISSAYLGTLSVLIVSSFSKSTRFSFRKLVETLEGSSRNALMISTCSACADGEACE